MIPNIYQGNMNPFMNNQQNYIGMINSPISNHNNALQKPASNYQKNQSTQNNKIGNNGQNLNEKELTPVKEGPNLRKIQMRYDNETNTTKNYEEDLGSIQESENKNKLKMITNEKECEIIGQNTKIKKKKLFDNKKLNKEKLKEKGFKRKRKFTKKNFVDRGIINGKKIYHEKGKCENEVYQKKTKLKYRQNKRKINYKYKNEGIEFLNSTNKEKEVDFRDQRIENEKINLQKEIKENESNEDKENKEFDIKIIPNEQQIITPNLQVIFKNIINNFLVQIKNKNSGNLKTIGNDKNNKMEIKNKIKMIDKMKFNEDQSFNISYTDTQTDSQTLKKDNQSNNDDQFKFIAEINDSFKDNKQISGMNQNINNQSMYKNISMNRTINLFKFNNNLMNLKVNEKINQEYMYKPKYYK
jgi:hypothetical protein